MCERPTDCLSVATSWSYKACPVPEHNAGPRTVRMAIVFLGLSALFVGGRFLARWRIQTAGIGIDDWTILLSFLTIIPATIFIILSESSQL